MAKKPPQKKRGASRMAEQGYVQVQIWLDKSEADLIRRAARLDQRPVATWVRRAAMDAAAEAVLLLAPPEQELAEGDQAGAE